jgi:hypothetical protein
MCRIGDDNIFGTTLFGSGFIRILHNSFFPQVVVGGYGAFFFGYLQRVLRTVGTKVFEKCCYLGFHKLSYKQQMENKSYQSKH